MPATLPILAILLVMVVAFYLYMVFRMKMPPGVAAGRLLLFPYLPLMALVGWAQERINIRLPRPLLWILGLALAVRLPLMIGYVWFDETFTAAMIQNTPQDLWQALVIDVNPPLGYAPFWLWAQVAPIEIGWVLRLPSLVFGLVAVVVMYHLAMAVNFTEREALTAALIFALIPAQIYYSAEARVYAFLTVIFLLTLLMYFNERPVWFVVFGVMLPFAHAYGYFYLLAIGLGVLFHQGWRWRWVITLGVLAVLSATYIPFILRQSGDVQDGYWLPDPEPLRLFTTIPTTLVSYYVRDIILFPVWLGMIGIMVVMIWTLWGWWRRPEGRFIALILVLLPLLAMGISLTWYNIYLPRAMVPTLSLIALPWTRMLFDTPQRETLLRFSLTLALIAAPMMTPRGFHTESYRVCAEQDADAAYFTNIQSAVVAGYYLDIPVYAWPPASEANSSYPRDFWPYLGVTPAYLEEIDGRICSFERETLSSDEAETAYRATLPAGEVIFDQPENAPYVTQIVLYER